MIVQTKKQTNRDHNFLNIIDKYSKNQKFNTGTQEHRNTRRRLFFTELNMKHSKCAVLTTPLQYINDLCYELNYLLCNTLKYILLLFKVVFLFHSFFCSYCKYVTLFEMSCLFICLPVYLSMYLSIYPVYLYVYLSIYHESGILEHLFKNDEV